MKTKVFLLFLLAGIFSTNKLLAANKGYKITVKLINSKDSILYLAHYFSNKTLIDDTACINSKGVFVFESAEKIEEGMYIIANAKKARYFDFFLTEKKEMALKCDTSNIAATMTVSGSQENTVFFNYLKYLADKKKANVPLTEQLKSIRDKESPEAKAIITKLEATDKNVKEYVKQMQKQHGSFLCVKFLNAISEVDFMPYCTDATGKVDSSRIFKTYKAHYWDLFDFSEPRLLYTPVFSQKVDLYFSDKMTVPTTDSMKVAINYLIDKSAPSKEMQKYMAWYLLDLAQKSAIMGMDALVVYIVKDFLESGKVEWYYPSVKENAIKRANTLAPILIGEIAPQLILQDTSAHPRDLYQVKAQYTLMFFWESNCGHCKSEIPKILEMYKEFHEKYDLEVFGISTDTVQRKWKEYVKKNNMTWINVNGRLTYKGNYSLLYDIHSTPQMFLLDENKRIIAKQVLTDGIKSVILNREEKQPANTEKKEK